MVPFPGYWSLWLKCNSLGSGEGWLAADLFPGSKDEGVFTPQKKVDYAASRRVVCSEHSAGPQGCHGAGHLPRCAGRKWVRFRTFGQRCDSYIQYVHQHFLRNAQYSVCLCICVCVCLFIRMQDIEDPVANLLIWGCIVPGISNMLGEIWRLHTHHRAWQVTRVDRALKISEPARGLSGRWIAGRCL